MSLHIIKIAYSALESKGKLEPTDVINILLTRTSKISDQLQKEIIDTLKTYPKEHRTFKKKMDQILESLDKLKEMT
ncbi:MAG: hypothetical protein V3S97_10425 [Candidatus Bathyarchaeia archaeon]